MYCRFAPAHLDAQIAHVRTSTPPGAEQEERIRRLRARVEQQAPLRALTCLMVACKVAGERQVLPERPRLNPQILQRLLETEGFLYSFGDIVRSEKRVLEQLQFRCFKTTTALEMLQLLLCAVVLDCVGDGAKDSAIQCQFLTSLETLHRTSVRLLECALLNRVRVYDDFYHSVTGRRHLEARHRPTFERISQDQVLFVGAALVAGEGRLQRGGGGSRGVLPEGPHGDSLGGLPRVVPLRPEVRQASSREGGGRNEEEEKAGGGRGRLWGAVSVRRGASWAEFDGGIDVVAVVVIISSSSSSSLSSSIIIIIIVIITIIIMTAIITTTIIITIIGMMLLLLFIQRIFFLNSNRHHRHQRQY
nr:uncharacterized protein LOC113816322 [Penaeus vannamei]